MESHDVVIVGAGIWGLRCLKTWLDLHPKANILAIDSNASVGGTWCAERLSLGLKSNNLKGTFEFPDFPMDEAQFGVKPYQHIPGTVLNEYVNAFCNTFDLHRRVRLNTSVVSVHADDDDDGDDDCHGWTLTTASSDGSQRQIYAQKLIIATGQTSQPMMPTIQGKETFSGRILHSVDLSTTRPPFAPAQSVAIYGGGKSAWDAAYECATATDKSPEIHMIVRSSGFGAHWFTKPFVTPFKVWLERFVYIRATTWLGPSVWGDEDGFSWARAFLHRTWLGRLLVSAFWGIIQAETEANNRYDSHPDTAQLKPRIAPFWVGTGLSILNYDSDFFALVRAGRIRVHTGDLSHLSRSAVHLSSGESISADTLVCCTGWQYVPGVRFEPSSRAVALGLPGTPDLISPREAALARAADDHILSSFPMLRNQPPAPIDPHSPDCLPASVSDKQPLAAAPSTTKHQQGHRAAARPYRLWRFMAPVDTAAGPPAARNIAFAGMMASLQTPLHATVQALWITRFLDGTLDVAACMSRPGAPRPPAPADTHGGGDGGGGDLRARIEYATILHSQFGRWRVPGGMGARFPDLTFDGLPYVDMLLRDLGVAAWRKRAAWLPRWVPDPREWVGMYTWRDYVGVGLEVKEMGERGGAVGKGG